MSIIGLVINRNNNYIYSKPFILNIEDKDIFIGQIIRDVDFGLIVDKNETINLEIIKYPNSMAYIDANINNKSHNFTVLGTYSILLDNLNNDYIFQKRAHGSFQHLIDSEYQLEIYFSYTTYKKSQYILLTPLITGKKIFLR